MNSENKPACSTTDSSTRSAVLSTISSLKEIVTIVSGLSVTNALVQLITPTSTTAIPSLQSISTQTLLLFLLLVLNIIRFYHGNMRHLDTTYTAELGKGSSGDLRLSGRNRLAVDFFVIFLQSLIFATLSFLFRTPTEFFFLFAMLLVVDVVWFLSAYQLTTDRKAFEHQRRWTLNNTVAVIALLVFIGIGTNFTPSAYVYTLSAIIALNTLVDFYISWEFYFPTYLQLD